MGGSHRSDAPIAARLKASRVPSASRPPLAGLHLRDLEYLVAVADHGHFGKAAEACAVSQPALSAQIAQLERRLGSRLFERQTRGITITPQGGLIVEQARRVITEARRLFDVAGAAQPRLTGEVAVGVIATLGPYLAPTLMRVMRETTPAARAVITEGLTTDLLAALRGGRLDVVLAAAPLPGAGLCAMPLFFEPFVLARRRSGGGADPQAPLDPDHLLLLEPGHCLRDQTLALCERLSRPGRGGGAVAHAASLETLRGLVAEGGGYAVLPVLAAVEDRRLSYAPIAGAAAEGAGRMVVAAWRGSDPRAGLLRRLAADIAAGPAVAARQGLPALRPAPAAPVPANDAVPLTPLAAEDPGD